MSSEKKPLKITIDYTPNNLQSLRTALQQYANLVKTGEAFRRSYCIVDFKPDVEGITLSSFEQHPSIHSFLQDEIASHELYYGEEIKDDISKVFLSETLLFAHALCYPELEEDIKSTCQAFVGYARKLNDSSKMWITSEEAFAADPLLLVAHVYPKYGYLLAGFLIPYWDDEHMPVTPIYLAKWSDKLGVTDDTIKAFCYCDNQSAREYMLGYCVHGDMNVSAKPYLILKPKAKIDCKFDLITYFRNSAEGLKRFKEMLVERFSEMPFLQFSDHPNSYVENAIETIVIDIMMVHCPAETWEDNFDKDEYLTQSFVEKTAETEIEEIKQYVEERLGHPIVNKPEIPIREQDKQEQEESESDLTEPLENWKAFFCQGINKGEAIWSYIQHGGDQQILATIPPANIYKLAENGGFALYNELDEVAYDMEDLWGDLEDLLKPLYSKYKKWSKEQGLAEEEYNERFLRFLDVLFALNDRTPFSRLAKRLVTDELIICNSEEFEERYAVGWFKQLESAIAEFGGFTEYVTRENIEACWEIIDINRKEAKKQLPTLLFGTSEDLNSKGKSERHYKDAKYQTTEKLVVAAYIAHRDQLSNTFDVLTEAALKYIDSFAAKFLWNDLYDDTDFPKPDIIKILESDGEKAHLAHYIPFYQKVKPEIEKLEQFVKKGYIEKDGAQLSDEASEKIAKEILWEYLEFDDEEISAIQKQVHWLRNFSHKTQKLLYVSHLVLTNNMEQLSSYNVLKRILKFAFELGPIRVSQFLAKLYKPERYELDDPQNMFRMLDVFKTQGLSLEGYWAYVLEEYAENYRKGNNAFYKELLETWKNSTATESSNNSLKHIQQKDREALSKGLGLLPREIQLKVIDHATEFFPKEHYISKYDHLLVDLILRELDKEHKILAYPEYFKNRLQLEGLKHQFIEWTEWDKYPEMVDKVLHHIDVEKPEDINEKDFEEQLSDIKGWKYMVLQNKGDKVVSLLGKKELWLIQNGFTEENINRTFTKAIIIDETCPSDNIEELINLSKIDYQQLFKEKTLNFLVGKVDLSELTLIFRCGINDYEFLKYNNYYDIDFCDLIMKVNPALQKRTFQMLGLISHECLDIELEMSGSEYLDLLLNYEVDIEATLKYLVKIEQYSLIQLLANRADISSVVSKVKIADQISILSVLAPLPKYHPLILKLKKHKSVKLKGHIKTLIEKYQIQ